MPSGELRESALTHEVESHEVLAYCTGRQAQSAAAQYFEKAFPTSSVIKIGYSLMVVVRVQYIDGVELSVNVWIRGFDRPGDATLRLSANFKQLSEFTGRQKSDVQRVINDIAEGLREYLIDAGLGRDAAPLGF